MLLPFDAGSLASLSLSHGALVINISMLYFSCTHFVSILHPRLADRHVAGYPTT